MDVMDRLVVSPPEFDVDALSDRQLGALLIRNAHLSTRIAEEWFHLTCEAHVERAHHVLSGMLERSTRAVQERRARNEKFHARCMTQKNGRANWVAANSEYEAWRAHNAAQRRRITTAITEVNKARKDNNRARYTASRNERPIIRLLANAINEHRAWLAANDYDSNDADRALWKCLDDITLPVGHDCSETSLTDMLVYHWT